MTFWCFGDGPSVSEEASSEVSDHGREDGGCSDDNGSAIGFDVSANSMSGSKFLCPGAHLAVLGVFFRVLPAQSFLLEVVF